MGAVVSSASGCASSSSADVVALIPYIKDECAIRDHAADHGVVNFFVTRSMATTIAFSDALSGFPFQVLLLRLRGDALSVRCSRGFG